MRGRPRTGNPRPTALGPHAPRRLGPGHRGSGWWCASWPCSNWHQRTRLGPGAHRSARILERTDDRTRAFDVLGTILALISVIGAFLSVLPSLYTPSQFAASSADRKSTRLNSSHLVISYAVFCLK